MNLSLRKKNDDEVVGIDVDGRYLAAAKARNGRLTAFASAELPEGVLADGEVADRDALTAALRDFADRHGLPRHVRLGVSNQQIVVRVVELPPISDAKERAAALRFSAAEAIAMPLDEAVLDHQVAGEVESEGAQKMQVVLVAARQTMVEEFAAAAKDAGMKVDGIDLDAFALVRTLAESTPDGEETARVFCHLGGITNLAVAVGSACFFTRALSTVTGEEGSGARLADEVRMSIDYYGTQPTARSVSEVVLSGPGSDDPELIAEMNGQLGIPVVAAAPLGATDGEALAAGDDPHRYTVAAGLALGAFA